MISLAAWMTVSMSALSKLSTTKRPRCSAGTSGAVLGAGGSVGGASTCGGGSAVSGLGPTEADGTGGSDSGDGGGGGGTVTAADGGAGRRAGRPGVAHPARSVMRQTAAVARFTLLLRRWRLLDGFARWRQGETAPQAWRETPAGRKESVDRRSLRLRHRLLRRHDPWRDQTGLCDGPGRGRGRAGEAGRRRLAAGRAEDAPAGDDVVRARGQPRRLGGADDGAVRWRRRARARGSRGRRPDELLHDEGEVEEAHADEQDVEDEQSLGH